MSVLHGDCLSVMATMDAASVDSIVSDPPYGLAFMGKAWDHGVPGVPFWAEALRVAKPGAFLVAFGGSRTYHRLTCAIEDAGWEIRDCLSWLYGSGFPKSHDVSKAMDKVKDRAKLLALASEIRRARAVSGMTLSDIGAAMQAATHGQYGAWYHRGGHMFFETGMALPSRPEWIHLSEVLPIDPAFADVYDAAEREVVGRGTSGTTAIWSKGGMGDFSVTAPATDLARQWHGWGTALKPAWEPIILARKPLIGTVAANVAQYGTGGINVDGCRIESDGSHKVAGVVTKRTTVSGDTREGKSLGMYGAGASFTPTNHDGGRWPANVVLDEEAAGMFPESRYFYTAKASRKEREAGLEGMPEREYPVAVIQTVGVGLSGESLNGKQVARSRNHHPTVKPIALMRWLCRLVTPPNGLVLDPFTGSGTTGCAAVLEGFRFIGIEREPEYVEIARKRVAHWAGQVAEPDLFGDAA